jgi:hypothetical protein
MIRACVGNARLDPAITGQADSDARPKAPGMKYRHYAPKAQLTIVEGSSDKVAEYINQQIAHKRNSPSYRKMLSQLVCARKNTAHKTVSVQ